MIHVKHLQKNLVPHIVTFMKITSTIVDETTEKKQLYIFIERGITLIS